MKLTVITACLCVPLLAGCNAKDATTASPVPAAAEQADQPEQTRPPYYAGLIAEYRAALAEEPENLAVLIALGNVYSDNGEWRKAIDRYEHALRIDPRNADVLTDLGTAFRNSGRIDRALEEYRLALRYDPAHVNARYNLGIVYAYDRNDPQAAVLMWEEMLRLAPRHPLAAQVRSGIEAAKSRLKKGTR